MKQELVANDDSTAIITLCVDDVLLAGDNEPYARDYTGSRSQTWATCRGSSGCIVEDFRPLGTLMYGKKLSLVKPEKIRLGEEANRRSQANAGCPIDLSPVKRHDTSHAVN